ncbi:MAG TPA: vWA domain-containing protein, partial [Solirubrobacteraceae bacterium]|nr:vWA domain-containing protein [Solirubrobacteraceae bacterium]
QARILAGTLQPTMWSPASSFWGRLLNYEADRRLVADENPSIARTPVVIAMWKELADAYGHPRKPMGYRELGELATKGWAAAGKPEFGPFKYVHTNPDFSTTGLSAVAASYYAAADKLEGLTQEDVQAARPEVRRLERSIVHYGDTTLFISEQMQKQGLGYASAAAMEETTLIDFNRKVEPDDRLVAIYPEEGTFFSDNPLMTLQADWVSPEKAAAAETFAEFLARAVTPQVAGRAGFRPADLEAKPAGLVAADPGVDLEQPARVLRLPEPKVLADIKAAWRADRKPANVMVVFDSSASMGEDQKLDEAKDGLLQFFRQAEPRDRMGLTKFSDEITPLVPIGPLRENRKALAEAVQGILPDAETRVRDAIVDAVETVERRFDEGAVNAVVALTDGADTASSQSALAAIATLARQSEKEAGQVRVFTIAYGSDADTVELERIAEATGGKAYKAGTDDIASIYRLISSFF